MPRNPASYWATRGIIRNRLKIAAAVTNAQAFLKVQQEFGSFDKYVWKFVGGSPIQNKWKAAPATAGRDAAGDGLEQRFKEARLSVCRSDNCLRVHAGHRFGERPPGELLPLQASGAKLACG